MNKHYRFLWLLLSLLLLAITTTQAQTRYVSTTGTQPASAATSWANSTTDLQGAINSLSATGGEVWVAAGLYKPTSTTDRTISFAMRNNVAIYGGFAGTETTLTGPTGRTLTSPLTSQPSSSTLSGDIGTPGSTTDNSYHVINNPTGLTTTAVLDGFVITGGNANGTFAENDGGGMYNDTSSPTLTNCVFRLNVATGDGGGMYNDTSSPLITNSIFEDNGATENGGCITNRFTSNPSLTDCIFRRNTAKQGAGMFSAQGSPLITRCLFQSNAASVQGGALLQSAGTAVITSCVFQSNTATDVGAIAQTGGNTRIVNCVFRQNRAIGTIGAIWVSSSGVSMTLINSSFEENTANSIGVLKLESVNIPHLTNCSFQNNSATTGTQAIYAGGGGVTLINCVFWNNGSNPANAFAFSPTASYCLFPIGTTGFTDGGNNLTTSISPFASTTSTELFACSPATNTGNNAATALTGITTDLAGNPRFHNNGTVDIGAYEFPGDGQPTSFSLLGSGTATCASSPTITLSNSETNVNYQLQRNGTNTGGALAGTGAALSFGPQSLSGTYTVLAIHTVNSCTALMAASTTISSNTTPPSVTITTVSNLSVIDCNVTVLSLSASGGGTYSWDNNQTIVSRNVNAGGTYSVTVTGANGCTAIATKTISQSSTPPPVSLTTTDVCAGRSVTLTATGGISSYTFVGANGVIGSGSTNITTVSGLSAGPQSFTVRVRNSVTSCTNTATASASVTAGPTLTITANPSLTITNGNTVTLTASGGYDLPGDSYTWTGNVQSATFTASPTTTITYSLTGRNASGCTSTSSVTVTVNQPVCYSVVYVTQNGAGLQNGSSWANAYPGTMLQTAINSATSCSGQVWVAAGIYKPTSSTDRSISFIMRNNVAIYGGFVGTETSLTGVSGRNLTSPVTGNPSSSTLSGEIGDPASTTDNTYHILKAFSLNSTALLDGFVIANGYSGASNTSDGLGQGMYNFNSSPTLTNCVFESHTTTVSGAGIYNTNSSPTLTHCLFQRNRGVGSTSGGGISNDNTSHPTLTNCLFRANVSSLGAGLYNNNSNPILTNCRFESNTATNSGGAINSTNNGRPVLTNCSFLNNEAPLGAGMFNSVSSMPQLTNCSFQGNTSTGTLYVGAGTLTLTNCVFWNNGGSNTISLFSSGSVVASYSLFDNTVTNYTSGPGNLTTSVSPFASTTGVALNVCAPAINTGDNSATGLTGITTDLESNTRVFGSTVDMGAVEFQAAQGSFTVSNPSVSTAIQSAAFSQTFTVTGGVAPRTFALASGTLPTGLTLGTDGVLSGTPTQSGTFSLTVRATDANTCSGVSSAYSLTVNALIPTITGFAGLATSVCSGNPVTFTATIGNVTGSYAYTLTNGIDLLVSTDNSTAFSQGLTLFGSSPQTVSLIVSDNGFSATATTSVTVHATPSVFYTSGPSYTITQGNTLTITAVSPGNSFRWSTGETTAVIMSTPTATTAYSVTTTTPAGCTRASTLSYTVIAPVCYSVVYVSQGGTGLQNGSSWANSYPGIMLQTAINSATSCGGQVWVATGTYKPTSYTGAGSRSTSFLMRNGVSIYGGFAEPGNPTFASRNPTSFTTILSGEIGDPASITDNSYHVVVANALNNTARLDGFVITGGNANSTGLDQFGGGIYNLNNSNPTLANCIVTSNTAVYGAGICNYIGSPTVQNCVLQNNVATISGGGLYSYLGIGLTLTNCVVQNNSAASGGGLHSDSGRLLLTNCTAQSNSATAGGAFVITGTSYSLTLTNGIVWNNGGGNSFSVASGSLVATYSLFEPSSVTYTGLTSGPGNLTTSISPFASPTSNELAHCSPAIDRGNNSATGLTGITTDLAGNARRFNSGVVDMGAYEFAGEGQPISFSLLGSGTATCASSPTLTLAGSETGVNYQLQRNGTNIGSTTAGTGSALVFGTHPASGTYTVLATRTSNSCTVLMGTSATVVSGTGTVSVTNPAILTAIQTVAFNQTFTASGGTAPYSFTLASGTLPMGLSLSASGVLSGTPTGTLGTFPITVRATDANSCSAISGTYSLTLLDPRPGISGFTAVPNVVCVNGPVTFTVTLADLPKPYSYALSDGISSTTGSSSLSLLSLTATPGGAGNYTYTLTVLGYAATSFALTSVTVSAYPTATLLANFGGTLTCAQTSLTLTASGGTSYTFAGPGGSGIVSQDQNAGTAVVNASGTYSVTVANASGCTSVTSLIISSSTGLPSVFLPSVSTATVGVTIAGGQGLIFTASGGAGSYSFTFGVLPPGLGIINSTATQRAIGGSVTQAGVFPISVTVTDGNGCSAVSAPYNLTVSCPTLSISLPGFSTALTGQNLTNMPLIWSAAGGTSPYSFTFATLPPGLSPFNQSNTQIRLGARPTQEGVFPISLTVTDNNGCSQVAPPFTLTVSCPSLTLTTTPSVSTALVGVALPVATLAWQIAGGTSPYSFSFSSFPPGLTTNNVFTNYYDLRGTPTQVGTFPISLTVTDANSCSLVNAAYSLTTSCATLAISTTTNPACGAMGSIAFTTNLPSGTYSLSYVGAGSPRSVSVSSGGSGLPGFSLTGLSAGSYGSFSLGYGSAACVPTVGTTVVLSNPASPTVTVTPSSGTLTCSQPSLTLTATVGAGLPAGTGLLWSTGATTTSITVNVANTYSVTATGANGCTATSNAVTISQTIGAIAPPTLSASQSAVCAGTTVRVVATVGGSPTGLQWYRNGQAVSGQTSATLSLGSVQQAQAGSYVLAISNGCSVTSSAFNLTVNPLPTAVLSFPVGTSISSGNPPTITLPPGSDGSFGVSGGIVYERVIIIDRINGFEIRSVDSSSTGRFVVNRTGLFTIAVMDSNGCRQSVQGIMANVPR